MRLALIAIAAAAAAAGAAEFRGFWLCPWEANTEPSLEAAVNAAADNGFNAILYEVRYRGDALYVPNKRSSRFPNPEPPSPLTADAGDAFDPLETLITKAHARGIQVHAWVTTFVIANRKTPTPPGHAFVEHPEWLSCNKAGGVWDPYDMAWLDPGVAAVQDYLFNVFMDVVANYDVDGLHLDYVRYTSPAFGYNREAVAAFEAETGLTTDDSQAFADWRRDRITSFVEKVQKGVTDVKPSCAFTTAVFASRTGTAYTDCLQDWTAWLERKYVDAVLPMAYGRDANVVGKQIRDAVGAAGDRHVYAGVLIPEAPADDFREKVPAEMVAKMSAAREAGAPGLVVFSYAGLTKESSAVASALKERLFYESAGPPLMAWKEPAVLEPEVVAVKIRGETRYAVKLNRNTPHRYAYFLAKEISARADCEVSIKDTAGQGWSVYAGAFDEKAAAADLRERLTALGYR